MTLHALALAAVLAFGHGTDSKAVLAEFSDYQSKQIASARSANNPQAMAEARKNIAAKAKELVGGVDPAKLTAEESGDYAPIFSSAGMLKEALIATEKYIPVAPESAVFGAHMSASNFGFRLKDYAAMEKHLVAAKVVAPNQAKSLASQGGYFAQVIAEAKGDQYGLSLVDTLLKSVNQPAISKDELSEATASLIEAKVDILREAKKEKAALALLTAEIPKIDAKFARSLNAAKIQLGMIGAAAPSITVTEKYGSFNSLEGLKGKVVILDFFAHWCGPCKAAFPGMVKMYSDLKPKGLEIVGVTTYYGYYGKERDLTKEVEFSKMDSFRSQFNITWPVVFGARDNFSAYGITGIPHVVVLDKKGSVRKIKVGFDEAGESAFRTEIEKLLAER